MGQFRVEWEDFSGGFFVGPNDADQPRNTWTGTGMTVSADQSMLMPAGAVTFVNPSGTEAVDGSYFQQFGGPIACSGFLNGNGVVSQIVVWVRSGATGSSPDYDLFSYATNGTDTAGSTLAGTSGDYYFPTGRPVALPDPTASTYNSVAAYYPMARNIAGAFTYFIRRWNLDTLTSTNFSIPIRLHVIDRWKEWIVGSKYETNRMHFSAAGDPTTWGTDDWVAIGDDSPITAIVPMANQIWIGKQQGWFIVTGVLGESTTVRPMDSKLGPSSFGAEATDQGIMFARSDQGVSLVAQRGMKSSVANHVAPASRTIEYQNPVDVSAGVIIAGGGPQSFAATSLSPPTESLYAWVYARGRWSKIALPTPSSFAQFMWAKDYTHIQVGEEYAWLVMHDGSGGASNLPAEIYRHQLNLTDPPASVSATATLSEWRRQNSGSGPLWFTVVEAIAEIEVPPTTAGSYSLGCVMRGVPDRTDTGTSYPTSPETVSFSSGSRRLVTVRTSVGSSLGNGVEPVVTLTGCKLRRLTLVCADSGQP
jgi:hypothetical protein